MTRFGDVVLTGRQYYVDPAEADQGAAGNGKSIKAYLTEIGTDAYAELILEHKSASAATSSYTVTTAIDMSTYPKIRVVIKPGAVFAGVGNITFYSPQNLAAGAKQYLFGGSGSVQFSAAGVVYPEWWGVDGSSDETEINLAFASLAAGGMVDLAAANYSVDGYITPASNTIMMVRPWTTITLAAASNCQILVFVEKTNVQVTGGGTLDGNKANQTGGSYTHIVYMSTQSEQIKLDGITIKDAYLDGVYIHSADKVIVNGCDITGCNYNGISVIGSSRVKITDNYFSGNVAVSGTANVILYGSPVNEDVIISGNSFYDSGEVAASSHGIYVYHTKAAVIRGNYFNDMYGLAVEINEQTEGAESTVIEGNTMIACGSSDYSFGSIWIGASAPTIVANNVIHQSELHGIQMDGSVRCVITGNIITDCKNSGTCITGSPTYSVIANNVVGGTGIATPNAGISISTSSNTVVGNVLEGSTYDHILTKENGLESVCNIETLADWRIGNSLDGLSGQKVVLNADYAIHAGYCGVYALDSQLLDRDVTLYGTFKQWSTVILLNVGKTNSLFFDPTGINEQIAAGHSGIFTYDGTNWNTINVSTLVTYRVSPLSGAHASHVDACTVEVE